MFRKNERHLQENLFSFTHTLSKKQQEEIKQSEEYSFYDLIFSKIKEDDFSCLYSEKDSRPNSAINQLVGAIILMQKNSWTYEELFKNIRFNLLTKLALGLRTMDEEAFSEATIFNFQSRLNAHFISTGEILLEKVFDRLTEAQLKELKLKTDIQRTDSLQAQSKIRDFTRLQLLVEMIIRLYRLIDETDKKKYLEMLDPYTRKTSGQFIYRLKKEDVPSQLEKLGQIYHFIYNELYAKYKDVNIFQVFERVYHEHFTIVDDRISVRLPEELKSSSLQSPDDIDATFRKKSGHEYYGQVISITETASPKNQLNLLTDIAIRQNNTNDSQILNERLDLLKAKTPDVNELHMDSAYASTENDLKFTEHNIRAIQTGLKGLGILGVEFSLEKLSDKSYCVSCPGGQAVVSEKPFKRYKAYFKESICLNCPFSSGKCQADKLKSGRVFSFDDELYLRRERLKNIEKIPLKRRSLRNNVEATVSEFTRKMTNKKLKVRGYFKSTVFAFSVAIGVNFGRIFRFKKQLPEDKLTKSVELSAQMG